jgi:hypothetical protein
MKRRFATAMIATALLAQANGVFAETSATPTALEGSDTFNAVMDNMLIDLALVDGNGIETYNGCGSTCGERAMIGNPSGSEPACVDTDGGENVGCQEVAPMSRPMGSAVCAAGNSEAVGQAEGIAVCKDGVTVLTDNTTLGLYGDDAAACAAYASLTNTDNAGSPPVFPDRGVGNLADSGTLPISGYTLGAGLPAGNEWRDVLRIVYTGCLQGDGDCMTANGTGNTSSGVPSRKRTERCSSPVRQELLSNWRYLLEGVPCTTDNCEIDLTDGNLALPGHRADDGVDDSGLKRAYRRDDSSGTTGVFLEFIGVRANLTGRAKVTATALESVAAAGCSAGLPPATAKLITPIPEQFAFCDGGHFEGFSPDCQNDVIDPIGGDPIRKNCSEADDICGPDGKSQVVQAIKSTRGSNPYPTHQCSRGQFAKRNYLASPHNVCPDGSKPSSGQCKLPFFVVTGGGQNFDCLNPFNSRPSTVPGTTDGRSYNVVMRTTTGTVDIPVTARPEVASWRYNMANMALSGTQNIFGKAYAAADYLCTEGDATRNIGCLLTQSTCSMGFAGREAAYTTATNFHLRNDPFQVRNAGPTDAEIISGAFPLARDLWFNAIGGMEQITAQCLARGDNADFCAEQKRIADEFWGTGLGGNITSGLCEEAGFVAKPRADVSCRGVTATCGAPLTQAMTDCVPN